MGKEKHIFSAGEINKYMYCPLQWYYTRTFGEAKLRALYREQNPGRTGHNPNFARGLKFHRTYQKRESIQWIVFWVILSALCVLCVFLWRRINML